MPSNQWYCQGSSGHVSRPTLAWQLRLFFSPRKRRDDNGLNFCCAEDRSRQVEFAAAADDHCREVLWFLQYRRAVFRIKRFRFREVTHRPPAADVRSHALVEPFQVGRKRERPSTSRTCSRAVMRLPQACRLWYRHHCASTERAYGCWSLLHAAVFKGEAREMPRTTDSLFLQTAFI